MKLLAWQSVLPWGVVVVFAWVSGVLAAERLTIGQLHKYHASYHMRSVTLVSKVEEMDAFPPLPLRGGQAALQLSLRHCDVCPGRREWVFARGK